MQRTAFSLLILLMAFSLFGQSNMTGYIHFRTVEKNDPSALRSGVGGIIELHDGTVNFNRDSVKAIRRRTGDRIWFSDSVSAQVIYEYQDSLRLLLNNNYIDYRALKKFSGNKNFLRDMDNYTWDFISEDLSFTLTPENKKSYLRNGASIYARIDFLQSNDVWDFHLKTNSNEESVTFIGFDLHHGFTTIQLIDEGQETIKCELYQDGQSVNGKLVRRPQATEAEILSIKAKLQSKKWLATWSYQQKQPNEIRLIGNGNSYITSRRIQNERVSFNFFSDGRYQYNNGKRAETGNWQLSIDARYVLLKSEEMGRTNLKLLIDSAKNVHLISIDHVKYKQKVFYAERVVFK